MNIKTFNLKSGQQEKEDREYWKNKTAEEKLDALERIRRAGSKLRKSGDNNEDFRRLRRVFRVVKQK